MIYMIKICRNYIFRLKHASKTFGGRALGMEVYRDVIDCCRNVDATHPSPRLQCRWLNLRTPTPACDHHSWSWVYVQASQVCSRPHSYVIRRPPPKNCEIIWHLPDSATQWHSDPRCSNHTMDVLLPTPPAHYKMSVHTLHQCSWWLNNTEVFWVQEFFFVLVSLFFLLHYYTVLWWVCLRVCSHI